MDVLDITTHGEAHRKAPVKCSPLAASIVLQIPQETAQGLRVGVVFFPLLKCD
jgi:hypothetical protein